MPSNRLAGIVLILGAVLVIIASSLPPRIYQASSGQDRLRMIADRRQAWIVSNALLALGGVVTAAGLALLSLHLRQQVSPWLNATAVGAAVLGGVFFATYVLARMVDPEPYFATYTIPWQAWAFFWLTELALALYAVAFLGSDFPNWLTYVSFAVVGGMAIGAWVIPESLPPQILHLLSLIVGIVAVL